VPQLCPTATARSTSLAKGGPTPAFVLARVFAADRGGVATYVRSQQRCGSKTALAAALRESARGRFSHQTPGVAVCASAPRPRQKERVLPTGKLHLPANRHSVHGLSMIDSMTRPLSAEEAAIQ
jgi:hypothetical protein